MEQVTIPHDLNLVGRPVEAFPAGIPEGFDELMRLLPEGKQRQWYGLSRIDDDGRIIYIVAAEERTPGEAGQYLCQPFVVPKGTYFKETLTDWRQKTDTIKDIFHHIMEATDYEPAAWCVEWYLSEREMYCLVKARLQNL